MQSVRAGIVRDWHDYPHTRVYVELPEVLQRARELDAYMEDVEYKRYKQNRRPTR